MIAAYAWAPWDRWNGLAAIGQLLLWSVLVVVALVMEVRAVLRSAHPWIRALQGSMVCAALQLLPFAGIYTAMSEADRATFTQPLTRLDAAYFTVTVFATVGFGDVAPVSAPARALVTVQMLADLILIGVIVKVLVGAAQRRRDLLRPLDPDRLRSQRGPAPGPAAQPGAFPGPDRRSGSVAAGPPVPGEDS
ncbi:MAG TPA: potassium channel family protein [Kineosporiaceae bacterium]|nr:potassium channel family protein [Kineosporiaceae bacterium]